MVKTPIKYDGQIELLNKNMGGEVRGKIVTDEAKILYIPVTYSDAWQASVDGKNTKIYCANYGFMAIEIPNGEHEVVLKYKSNIFTLSCFMSFGGFILTVSYCIFLILKIKCKRH